MNLTIQRSASFILSILLLLSMGSGSALAIGAENSAQELPSSCARRGQPESGRATRATRPSISSG